MLEKAPKLNKLARETGVKVLHAPISFAEGSPKNPNGSYGILKGCKDGELFKDNTFGVEFYETMEPQDGDICVNGKKGLDAFSNTDLDAILKDNKIENVILTGFLTNCCVESTMRTAYEKGYKVFTVPDCCGSLSDEAQASTQNAFNYFSSPMSCDETMEMIQSSYIPTIDLKKTAVVNIEFQNEFCHPEGKLYGMVEWSLDKGAMLERVAGLNDLARDSGCKIIHAPISFAKGSPDNQNPTYGILAGCKNDELFKKETSGAEFVKEMTPKDGDLIVTGKRGLDAFSNTDLDALLKENKIDNVILTGFLTNCCVESTMRTAYELGYNVFTVPDCCGSADEKAQMVTQHSFVFFSTPKSAEECKEMIAFNKTELKASVGGEQLQ